MQQQQRRQRHNALVSAAAVAAIALAAQVRAGQLFSFEDAETVTVTTPAGDRTWLGGIADDNLAYQRTEGTLTRYDPNQGYIWGNSFESDSQHQGLAGLQDHTRSTIGATDGSYSMKVHDPTGGFKWGTQILFNNPTDSRFIELTTSTKIMVDQSTPGGDPSLPTYQVGFGAVNYAAGFIDSYNTSGAGTNYQFASGPASQTALTTQTYIFPIGEQMRFVAGSLWPSLTNFVILHFNTNSPSGQPADYYYDNFRVINEDVVTRPTWKAPIAAGGSWTDAANWDNGVPNGVGAQAIFYGRNATNGTAALSSNVTVPSAISVGSLIFDAQITSYQFSGASGSVTSPNDLPAIVNYTLTGPGSLTFDVASGIAELYTIAGNQTINVPVTVNDSMRIDTTAGFGPDNNPNLPGGGRFTNLPRPSLTFGQPVTVAAGTTLRTSGAGSVTFNGAINAGSAALLFNGGRINVGANVTADSLTVAPAARLTVTTGGNRVVRTNSLTIGNGSLSSTVDLTNNKLIVDYTGTSPLPDIKAKITSAYNAGAWTGPGLTTSAGDAQHFALGYGESSAVFTSFPATFGGQQVDNTAVLVTYTRYGDADLNGTVNLSDFNRLASNFGTTGKVWTQGDFNYDGTVNLGDFNLLAGNFGLSAAGSEVTPQDWANLAAAVPEPSLLILSGVPALAGMRRRRRAC
jgi:hypothetical protein